MSRSDQRNALNAPGAWYCTHPEEPTGEGCIACATCFTAAPDFFAKDANGNAYVARQPLTEEERALCMEQLESCPVGSIGRDV